MKHKSLIVYCAGGLGNRLKPLAGAFEVARAANREVKLCWMPALMFQARWDELFCNPIELLDEAALPSLGPCSFYIAPNDIVDHESTLNHREGLRALASQSRINDISNIEALLQDPADNVILFSNEWIPGASALANLRALNSLVPVEGIRRIVLDYCNNHRISRDDIGVFARGTDFEDRGVTVDSYRNAIGQILRERPNARLFVCSDSSDYEDKIVAQFGDKILVRKKTRYVTKDSRSTSWCDNVSRNAVSIQEALANLIILSRTTFRVFPNWSTFGHVAYAMSQGKLLPNPPSANTAEFDSDRFLGIPQPKPWHTTKSFSEIFNGRGITSLKGVIYVGASSGQEVEEIKSFTSHGVFIEPIPESYAKLITKLPNTMMGVKCAVGSTRGTQTLHLASNQGESSSLLTPATHTTFYPTIHFSGSIEVPVFPLRDIISREAANSFDTLVIDTQGTELDVLRSYEENLQSLKYIIVEFSQVGLYENSPKLEDLDAFLTHHNFTRAEIVSSYSTDGIHLVAGDALYIKNAA